MLRRNRVVPFAMLALLLSTTACRHKGATNAPATDHATSNPIEDALHTDAGAGHLASLHWPNFSDYQPLVVSFYDQRGWDPAWVDGHKATKQAMALIHLFAMSGSKGLNADDYDAALWQGRLAGLSHASDAQIAEFDTAMTVATMRYISDLHIGRVNPQHFAFGVNTQSKKYDLPSFLVQQVVAADDMDGALKDVEPDSDEYRNTIKALNHYQELAQQLEAAALPVPAKPITRGAPYPGAAALGTRLTLLGDMEPGGDLTGSTYTPALSDAVRAFQARHSLATDGRLTPQTVAALNVPLVQRVHQLEDTLERLRWLPPQYQQPPIEVNIPEFTLRAFDDDHKQQFEMRVIVGDSDVEDHKTPVLVHEMTYVVLRPFWNVTPTIVKDELGPHVEANKGYLESKNFEVVDRAGKPVENWTAAELEKNLYMVREKPGPTNSLGLIKFMLPNKLNIYLHSTPAVQLFARSKRDFSHGCIRLQNPEQLADWVLRDKPEWTPDAIHDAMENGEDNKIVPLSHPIPVRIFYETARVGDDGKVYFFNDLYGYDKDMEDTLSKGDPFPVKPEVKKDPGDTA